MDEKRVIEVDEYQHGLILHSLNDKRNELVEQGKDTEFVDAIQEDIHWLGFDWGDRFFYGSDYFEKTEFVDDTLIEVMDAPMKREKKRHRDERER